MFRAKPQHWISFIPVTVPHWSIRALLLDTRVTVGWAKADHRWLNLSWFSRNRLKFEPYMGRLNVPSSSIWSAWVQPGCWIYLRFIASGFSSHSCQLLLSSSWGDSLCPSTWRTPCLTRRDFPCQHCLCSWENHANFGLPERNLHSLWPALVLKSQNN